LSKKTRNGVHKVGVNLVSSEGEANGVDERERNRGVGLESKEKAQVLRASFKEAYG